MASQTRTVVVDADVMRSATDRPEERVGSHCYELLQLIYRLRHAVAFNPQLKAEWDKHQSRLAREWLASVIAARQYAIVPAEPAYAHIVGTLDAMPIIHNAQESGIFKRHHDALMKDAHVLATALQADRLLLSKDNKARTPWEKYFSHAKYAIEWHAPSDSDTEHDRQSRLERLRDLATTRPNPPLPTKVAL